MGFVEQLNAARTFEQEVQAARQKILNIALQDNLPSDVLMAAMADVLGDVAGTLDQHCGHQPIEKRLAVIMDRAKQSYGRRVVRVGGIGR